MNTMHDHDEPIDPRLQDMFDRLRPTPPRDPEAAAQAKTRFMAELDELFTNQPQPSRPPLTGWPSITHTLKESFTMLNLAQRTVLTTLIVLAVFLIGGFSMTAAAQSALPGDALYTVKTGMEQAQISMKSDPGLQAELYMEFAGRRLAEIEKLVEAGRYEEIEAVAAQFQASVQKALQAVQALAVTNPSRAAELASLIANKLAAYANTLSELMASVPASVQNSLQSAASSAQGALDNQNGNDNANDNANGNGDDNGNDNANGNGDDDNANGNGDDDNGSDDNGGDDNGGDDNGGDDNGGDDNGGDDNGGDDNGGDDNGGDDNGGDDNGGDDNGGDDNGGDDNGGDDNGGDDNGGDDNGGDDNGGGDDNDDNSGSASTAALFSAKLVLIINALLI